MTIDPDIRTTARYFGVDATLIQAVVDAEGGGDHIIRAVQCSYPTVTTREKALEVLCRTTVHALSDYVKMTTAREFVAYFGNRWAPVGADNDPTHLNANWVPNVRKLWNV